MTDAQLFALFASFERGEGGYPKFEPIDDGPGMTPEFVYRQWLRFACGITDPSEQASLWRTESAKRERWKQEHEDRDRDD